MTILAAAKKNGTPILNGTVHIKPKKTKRVALGIATNELIFSACQAGNDEVFPNVLKLFLAEGSLVADVTYGRGVFWKNIPQGAYDVRATDLRDGMDCRNLPYGDSTFDCVVFDPPYMHTPGGTAHQNHQHFEHYYYNNGTETAQRNITRPSSTFILKAPQKRTEC
jgi:hypothetical protein